MKSKEYGDLYIRIITEVPVGLSKEQKELLEKFKSLEDSKTNPSIKDFFEKAKNFGKINNNYTNLLKKVKVLST